MPARPLTHLRFDAGFMLLISLLAPGGKALAADVATKATEKCYLFPAAGLTFDAEFPGGRLDGCTQMADGRYQLLICSEVTPINDSAWYAFRIRSNRSQVVDVELTYKGGSHRYIPKISRDGKTWFRLTGDAYQRTKDKPPRLRMNLVPGVLWVAGQELLLSNDLYGWARCMAITAAASESELGRSAGGRPLLGWKLGNASSRDLVVILGRQHPPEITGSLALMAFVDTLAEESEAARRFRRRFQVLVVPLMNPDGVELGHWRCNLNGIDLNRDWAKFSQPETRCVREEIQRLVSVGKRPSLLLDFHSTDHDVFYTQADDDRTVPQDFAKRWLAGLHERLPEYQFRRDSTHQTGQATSKAWGYATYRIPAITYEVGDNTDRTLVRKVARTAAEEMMRLLLGYAVAEKLPSATPAPAKPVPVPSLN
jgi:hypothetical protein